MVDVKQGHMDNIIINDILFIANDVSIYNYADKNCTTYAHSSIDQIKCFVTR